MNTDTQLGYDEIISHCKGVFLDKTNDYGSIWRHVRLSTITDEIFIKVKRIKTIEENKTQAIDESVESEYLGIINYSIMAQIQLKENSEISKNLSLEQAENLFLKYFKLTKDLMVKKNQDYGEAWRDMRLSSLTDVIFGKVLRIKKMEEHKIHGSNFTSEGPFSNYQDIVNYAVFALLKIQST